MCSVKCVCSATSTLDWRFGRRHIIHRQIIFRRTNTRPYTVTDCRCVVDSSCDSAILAYAVTDSAFQSTYFFVCILLFYIYLFFPVLFFCVHSILSEFSRINAHFGRVLISYKLILNSIDLINLLDNQLLCAFGHLLTSAHRFYCR